MTDKNLYSHHIFLFPFKWKIYEYIEDTNLRKKFDVNKFTEFLIPDNNSDNSLWKSNVFQLNRHDNYNEYNYFYEHVRKVMYDRDKDLVSRESKEASKNLIKHFRYKKGEQDFYNFELSTGEKYSLEIDSILLNIYCTGTAVLSFHLKNFNHPADLDILKINKFGRRLYVPFFDLTDKSVIEDGDHPNENPLGKTKEYEIPEKIWIGSPEASDDKKLNEDFTKYESIGNPDSFFQYGVFSLPAYISDLFPENFFSTHTHATKSPKIYLSPVTDDRMHVLSWYGNISRIREINCCEYKNALSGNLVEMDHYQYEKDDWWYSYIFVDYPAPMHKDKFKKRELIQKSTYSRWVEWETLYGISRYSMVMLTSDFDVLKSNNLTYLVKHLQSIYYKMYELCLLQRATVLNYSDEVTHVSNLLDFGKDDSDADIINQIESLYKHYILFVNKIYFKEITNQEQGIELYDMIQSSMRLDRDVKELDGEIEELNRLANLLLNKQEAKEAKKEAKAAIQLNKIATILLVPALIAGILGMNTIPDENLANYLLNGQIHPPFAISMVIIILSIILTRIYIYYNNKI